MEVYPFRDPIQAHSFPSIQAVKACSQKIQVERISKVIERCLWDLPRSLFDTVEFRVQLLISNTVLLHRFPRFRLGLLESFPMYVAFPRSKYYYSSDFSKAILKTLLVKLGFEYLYLLGMEIK